MAAFKISALAERDLIDIRKYIYRETRSHDIGRRFVDSLAARFALIAESPGIGPAREDIAAGVRYHPVGDYNIFYSLQDGEVLILRIYRSSRDQNFMRVGDGRSE